MPTILVTGGSGFIGSHTCFSLLKHGFEIIILDNHSNSKIFPSREILSLLSISDIERIKVINGDICNLHDIQNVFRQSINKIDAVIHFAGLKSVPESFENPTTYWNTNVSGTINLLQAMDKFHCHNLIFSSSATIYGGENGKPIVESDPIDPTSPYGWTKYVAEKIITDHVKSSKRSPNNLLNAIILRYFNPVGALKNGILGESPQAKATNLFPMIMKVITRKTSCLNIHGNDWPTIDGTGVRDYIHVMDLADGHVAALKYILSKQNCLVKLNLGTGMGHSVLEVIKMFERVIGNSIPHSFQTRREGDVASCVADSSLALQLLNWKAKRNLSDMCHDSWNYWKCRSNL